MSDFQFEPKIRVKLPSLISEILKQDSINFAMNANKLCNTIFAYYAINHTLIEDISVEGCNNQILQFTLNNENQDAFMALCDTINISTKALFFRNLFFQYCNQPIYVREQIIYNSSYQMLLNAIKARRKLKIRYKNSYRIIEPYFIIKSDGETRNYVFAYCDSQQRYCNYRLSNIHAVGIITKVPFEHYDAEYIKTMHRNFDAFLSYGQTIQVRLDEIGQQMFQRNLTHRPKLLNHQKDIFELECSQLKAQLYFPQFMHHAEILSPPELRTWFHDQFTAVYTMYTKDAG